LTREKTRQLASPHTRQMPDVRGKLSLYTTIAA
jgi:hypothetical protein